MNQKKGVIRGICISPRRGTAKYPVETAKIVPDWGIEEDAHGGKWHRQISLLALEKIEAFREKGADVDFGAFGENLIVEGFDLRNVPVDSEIRIGDAVRLKVTQIGKECHSHCAIYQRMGDCIMPREGIFAEVLTGGMIRVGDCVEVVMPQEDRPYSVAVITLSDKAFAGERDDLSGPAIEKILKDSEEKDHIRFNIKETILLPDGEEGLKKQLIRLADQRQVDLILTTGGTGFAPRDMTPEATIAVCDRMANGIADALFDDDHRPCNVQPGSVGNAEEDTHYQSSGEPESSDGSTGVYSSETSSWTGCPERKCTGMWQEIILLQIQ